MSVVTQILEIIELDSLTKLKKLAGKKDFTLFVYSDLYARKAAELNRMCILKYLVSCGLNPLNDNHSAVHSVAESGHIEMLKYLLSIGGSPLPNDKYNRNDEFIKKMMKEYENPSWVVDDAYRLSDRQIEITSDRLYYNRYYYPARRMKNAMWSAAVAGHLNIVKLLAEWHIDHGWNIDDIMNLLDGSAGKWIDKSAVLDHINEYCLSMSNGDQN